MCPVLQFLYQSESNIIVLCTAVIAEHGFLRHVRHYVGKVSGILLLPQDVHVLVLQSANVGSYQKVSAQSSVECANSKFLFLVSDTFIQWDAYK